MELANRVNLDFDQALHLGDIKFTSDKILKEFEYIYFLSNAEAALFSNVKYDEDYLSYLVSKGFTPQKIVNKCKHYINWWGNLDNIEIARVRNSKIVNTEWAIENKFCPSSVKVVNNEKELNQYREGHKDNKFYYRSEFGFSGISNKILDGTKNYSLRYPGVVAQYLNIVFSFGVTVNLETMDYYMVENIIDENGRFRGGMISEWKEIAKQLSISNEEFSKELSEIFQKLRVRFGAVILQFDSLLYWKDGKVLWYKVVEINYRRTMGHIIKCLYDKFGPGEWIFDQVDKVETYQKLEKSLSKKYSSKLIITSPKHTKILSYYRYK